MGQRARYDGIEDWYEQVFTTGPLAGEPREPALRLLGPAAGSLLDVACGGGGHTAAFAEAGWDVTGVDESADQLRYAAARGVRVVQADAGSLPFADSSFDAVVSIWLHTDADDFAAVVREVARVLRRGGPFVYVGAHPCFIGPHSRFVVGAAAPVLHPGYHATGRYSEGPAIWNPEGLRTKVGALHLPLADFMHAFLDAGLGLEHFEEPAGGREYPYMVALRWRR
jgi:SAM-dependent methyltransferase